VQYLTFDDMTSKLKQATSEKYSDQQQLQHKHSSLLTAALYQLQKDRY